MPTSSPIRPRRLRSNPLLRDALAHTRLLPSDLTAPLFIRSGTNQKIPIPSLPGVFQFSPDTALLELQRLQDLGLTSYLLFGVTDPALKDPLGSHAHNPDNEVCTTLKRAKDAGIRMLAITDLCYCEYTSHGHCGPLTPPSALSPHTSVDNDLTIQRLGQQAVLHARSGADIVAPSGMMDNMVAAIRQALDQDQQLHTLILSYAVKFASNFYGPFREAANAPPEFKASGADRKTYQMDYRGAGDPLKEALREAALDVAQGADLLMVKPGLPYLDILRAVTDASPVPTAVYQVSGEYAMLKAAAAAGALEEKPAVLETLTAFKRAGASLILTYYAPQAAHWLTHP